MRCGGILHERLTLPTPACATLYVVTGNTDSSMICVKQIFVSTATSLISGNCRSGERALADAAPGRIA